MDGRNVLICLSLKFEGDWEKIRNAIGERLIPEDLDGYEEMSRNLKCKTLTLLDPEYPESLKNTFKPPFVLYYYGDLDLIQDYSKCVSVIGSRKANPFYLDLTRKTCQELSDAGYSIVSGLAYGIDTAASEGSVELGKAVAVLGNGIDYYYPPENSSLQRRIREMGLLISEYPGYTSPATTSFPLRNRIVAGLSCLVVVPEARHRSGSMITVTMALNAGKEIACFPTLPGEESACNSLIKDGASLVESASDILSLLESICPA